MIDGQKYMYIGFLKNAINDINKGCSRLELTDTLHEIAWQIEAEFLIEQGVDIEDMPPLWNRVYIN